MVLAGNFRKIEIMKPYRKIYDSKGVLTNPITKEMPYLFTPIATYKTFGNGMWQKIRNKFFVGKNIVKLY